MTSVVLDDLAGLPPGPGLAAALGAVELGGVPNDRMLQLLAAQHRQLCHEQARMAAVLAELGRCARYPAPGAVLRLVAPERYASEESRAALRWTRRAAEWEHELAETVVHAMPALHAAWLAGRVDRPRVLVFHRFLTGCTLEQIDAICRVAVPRAPRLTTGQLAVLLRRMVLAADPAAAERWYRKGVRERNVVAVTDPDGTVTLSGHGLPADEAEAACVRVQELAAAARRAGHPGLIGQIRCDLFLGLLDGRFHGMDTAQVIAALIAQFRPEGPGSAVARPGDAGLAGAGNGEHRSDADADPHAAGPRTGDTGTDNAGTDTTATGTMATGTMATGTTRAGATRAGATGTGRTAAGRTAADGRTGGSRGTGTGHGPDPAPGGGTRPAAARAAAGGALVGIEVRVALSTLLGRDEHPGEIPGLGLLPAPDTRARVALQRRVQWRFAVTDDTGRLMSEGVTRRRPTTVGGYPVRRDGPPGGIVEIHIPVGLLHELASGEPGEWAGLIADVVAQHARRDIHLTDLDARPGDRFPGAACAATARSATAPASSPAADTAPTPPTSTTPATGPPPGPPSPRTPARCAVTTTTSNTAAAGGSTSPSPGCSSGTARWAASTAPAANGCSPSCPTPSRSTSANTSTRPPAASRGPSCSPAVRSRALAHPRARHANFLTSRHSERCAAEAMPVRASISPCARRRTARRVGAGSAGWVPVSGRPRSRPAGRSGG